ncbi:hypothetical protein DSECCO2_601920 [anaerobic digester metagenome]
MQRQGLDVLHSLPKRRQRDDDGAQPVEQVLAEHAVCRHDREVAVGRGHEPEIALQLVFGTHRPEAAVLEHAQKRLLYALGQLADLVEKERAAVGQLEQPVAVAVRVGERAFDVAKQHAFDQRFRQRGAVHHHEVVGGAGGIGVYGAGEELLARAGLAADEHRGVGIGGLGHEVEAGLHGLSRADDAFALERGARPARGLLDAVFQGARERQGDAVGGKRLLDVVPGPGFDGQGRALGVVLGGDDDDFRRPRRGAQLGQQVQAVAVRQAQIEKHHVEAARGQRPAPVRQRPCPDQAMPQPPHERAECFLQDGVVVDEENVGHNPRESGEGTPLFMLRAAWPGVPSPEPPPSRKTFKGVSASLHPMRGWKRGDATAAKPSAASPRFQPCHRGGPGGIIPPGGVRGSAPIPSYSSFFLLSAITFSAMGGGHSS